MISIAGRYLPILSESAADWVETYISPSDVLEFDPTAWNNGLSHLPAQGYTLPPIEIGTFYWPQGYSNFAVGYFIADETDMAVIRPLAFTDTGPQPVALVMNNKSEVSDVTDFEITTDVYLMPPRPLSQISGETELYLLTVVDYRYFGWFKGADITATGTWDDYFGAIASALGISISRDTPLAGFGSPSNRFTVRRQPLPLLLDAAAMACGLRVSRKLDGTVQARNYATDAVTSAANILDVDPENGPWYPLAGGEFGNNELTKSVPDTVEVVFGRTDDGVYSETPYVKDITLTSLALSEFGTVDGFSGKKVLTGDLNAIYVASSLTNNTALTDYAEDAATCWYKWQLGATDISLSAICNWIPTGLDGMIAWTYRPDMCCTRITRGYFNEQDWGKFRRSLHEGERSWIIDGPVNCDETLACINADGTTDIPFVEKVCATYGVLSQDAGTKVVSLDGVPIGSGVNLIKSISEHLKNLNLPTSIATVTDLGCVDATDQECCPDIATDCCEVDVPYELTATADIPSLAFAIANIPGLTGAGEPTVMWGDSTTVSFPLFYDSVWERWLGGSVIFQEGGCTLTLELELMCNVSASRPDGYAPSGMSGGGSVVTWVLVRRTIWASDCGPDQGWNVQTPPCAITPFTGNGAVDSRTRAICFNGTNVGGPYVGTRNNPGYPGETVVFVAPDISEPCDIASCSPFALASSCSLNNSNTNFLQWFAAYQTNSAFCGVVNDPYQITVLRLDVTA